MRGFLLLFRRDLQQRWMLFVASLAMGLFNVGLPLLRSRISDAELRGAAGLITALTWAVVLAIVLGGSIFTRDLTENRLAFDFRLPVRPGAIWAARLFAAILTTALAGGLVVLPSVIAGMDWRGASAGLDEWIGHGIQGSLAHTPFAIFAILLLANSVALASRSRSAWAALDFFSFAAAAGLAYGTWLALQYRDVSEALWSIDVTTVLVLLLGVGLSLLLQVSRGRTEIDKAQKALSLGVFLTSLLAAAGFWAGFSWMYSGAL